MVTDTSLDAYESNQESFENDREHVLYIIDKHGPISRSNVARKMEKPIHSISGRFTELKSRHEIKVVDTQKNRFGNKEEVLDTDNREVIFP